MHAALRCHLLVPERRRGGHPLRRGELLPVQVSVAPGTLLSALGPVALPVAVVPQVPQVLQAAHHNRVLRHDSRVQVQHRVEDHHWAGPIPDHPLGGRGAAQVAGPGRHRLLEHWSLYVRHAIPLRPSNYSCRGLRAYAPGHLRRYDHFAVKNVHVLLAFVLRVGP